ncbi:MAG TPA: pyrroloquinoline quinone biosynthesis protein PqqB [Gemmatimonadaceae bacterium]|nr:pyrroloquinoline quinone biosynthesis protein PqqB [Gemmatimonadaceae bacterium]
MHVLLLGTAAGGGFPQWNCRCATCEAVRESPPRAAPRTQSSIAVSADGAHWFLGNASPDVRAQLERLGEGPPGAVRWSPVEGVVFPDADLDHSLGLALLREARLLPLFATRAVLDVVTDDSRILPVTRTFADVPETALALEHPTSLKLRDGRDSVLTIEMIPVRGSAPRFARREMAGHTSAAVFQHVATGRRLAYVPACAAIDDTLLGTLHGMELVLFDGTCFTDDEMRSAGVSDRTATAMGHQPISGARGSLPVLRELAANGRTRVAYVHINNTNPILLHGSPQRAEVEAAGITIGEDGMRLTV